MHWLGALHVRHPRIVAGIIAAITLAAMAGLPRVQFNDDPRTIFRFKDPQFDELQAFYDEFGEDDQDLFLVIDGAEIFKEAPLTALHAAYLAVRELPEVETIISLYEIHKRGPLPLMLMPVVDLSPERIARAKDEALANPGVVGQFLSPDGKTTFMGVRLKGHELQISELGPLVAKVRGAAEQHLTPAGLRLRLAGHPPTRIDLLATMRTEVLKFTALSAAISGLIALLIFRTPLAVVIAVVAPIAGVVWMMGAMGWIGAKIDPLTVVLPTLMFVVGFTDAVHLVTDIQVARDRGDSRLTAAAGAVAHLGPACLFTALTTMSGFGSLAVAHVESIRAFGITCACGTAMMFLAVQLVVPALAVSRLGDGLISHVAVDGARISTRLLEPLYSRMLLRPRTVAAASAVLTVICFAVSMRLKSDQRWMESLPDTSDTVQVTRDCDRMFGGSMFAYVVVEWPEGMELRSAEVLETLAEVHAAGEEARQLRGPLSVLTLLETTRRPGDRLADQVRHLRRAPPNMLRRFVREDLRKAVVSLHVPDIGAAQLAPDFAELDSKLSEIEKRHPGFKLRLTGTVVVAARNVYQMIDDLARSMTVASVIIFVLMIFLLQSIPLGLLSIIPNILPQAFIASGLVLLNQPLTMTSVMTFSICFGLSVDDTVHFLMRYRYERQHGGTPRSAVLRTFRAVGGVMITTSLVLVGGFMAMLVSQMPAVRMFGLLSCATLLAAILGDLIMLPSLILMRSSSGRGPRQRGKAFVEPKERVSA